LGEPIAHIYIAHLLRNSFRRFEKRLGAITKYLKPV
jgi:hypothetical protein